MRLRDPFFATLALLALTGCLQLPTASDPVRVIAPNPPFRVNPDWPAGEWTLLVQRPMADQMRSSARVVVNSGSSRLSFYPGVMWLDEMPDMLQSLILQGFVDANRLVAVARPGTARGVLYLATEVRRFEAKAATGAPLEADLELYATLVDVRSAAVIAARTFGARVPADGPSVEAITRAFEIALGDLITQIVDWTLTQDLPETTSRGARAPGVSD
jgi:cholesterol transport system auxiliary component